MNSYDEHIRGRVATVNAGYMQFAKTCMRFNSFLHMTKLTFLREKYFKVNPINVSF